MANETLLLRKGLLANLAKADYIEGALSFTTDEPAIYIDIDNEHKRIGDIKQFANAKAFSDYIDAHSNHLPTTALYYIVGSSPDSTSEDDKINGTVFYNALLKWTGSTWIQINEKSDYTGDIESLQSAINAAAAAAEAAQDDIDALEKTHATDKAALEGSIGTVSQGLADHKSAYETKIAAIEQKNTEQDTAIGNAANAAAAEKTRAEAAEKALGGRIDGVNTALEGKQATITGAASTITEDDLTAGRVLISNAEGKVDESTITTEKLGYLTDVTSNIGASISGLSESIGTINNNLGNGTVDSRIATAKSEAIAAAKTETQTQVGAEAEARAAAIKVVADDLSAHKTAYSTKITQLESADTANSNALNTLTTRVGNLETADTTIRGEFAAADTKLREDFAAADATALGEAKTYAENQAKAVRGETNETVASVAESVSTLSNTVNGLSTKIGDAGSGLTKDVADLKAADTTIRGEIATAKSEAISDANDYTDAEIAKVKGSSSETIASLDTKIGNNYNTLNTAISNEATARGTAISNLETAYKAADTALETKITTAYETYVDGKLQAADAMVFKGVANAASDLPTTGVEAGWTYKVGTNFVLNGEKVYVGDLLIAKADQTGDSYTGGWDHVASGYEDDHDVHIEMTSTGAKIVNAAGQNRGSIAFEVAAGSNLAVAVSEVAKDAQSGVTDMKVTLSLAWGSF